MRQPSVIDEALAPFGGSARRLAQACDVAVQTVYLWIGAGSIPTRQSAVKVAAVLAEKGCQVSAARLMGLEDGPPRRRRPTASGEPADPVPCRASHRG